MGVVNVDKRKQFTSMIRVGMYKTVHFFLEKEGLKGSRNVVPERGRGGGGGGHVLFQRH